jgi:SAM-dependent methyltransferase
MMRKIKRKLARMIAKDLFIETYFNVPLKFDGAAVYFVNERILEVPFVFAELKAGEGILKILDFGCTRSWLSLSLASLGHHVHGIDLRNYPFAHKNLVFKKQDILDYEGNDFDLIIALSSLEHVGLGAYGEDYNPGALAAVLAKMEQLLTKGGRLILTVPVGKSSVDSLLKSFTPGEIENLVAANGFALEKSRYFKRHADQQWLPCPRAEMLDISNHETARVKSRTGSNGIGCLVFQKGRGGRA